MAELDWGALLLTAKRMRQGVLVHIYKDGQNKSLCYLEERTYRKSAGENSIICPSCLVASHEHTPMRFYLASSLKRVLLRFAGWIEKKDYHGYPYYDKA